jgi:hypothetical protein
LIYESPSLFALKAHRKLACGFTTGNKNNQRFRSEGAAQFREK